MRRGCDAGAVGERSSNSKTQQGQDAAVIWTQQKYPQWQTTEQFKRNSDIRDSKHPSDLNVTETPVIANILTI